MNLTFDDEFNSLSLNMDTPGTAGGTWDTYFSGWGTRSLTGNGEQEVYVDPSLAGTSGSALGLNPFSDQNGVMTITASPTPSQDKSALWNMPYTSGLLNTQTSFSQTYGYFEINAKLPGGGQGLWPAFWLLPENNSWPPEIDVFEQVDNPSSPILSTVHDASGNVSQSFNVGDTSAGYHTYGVLWTSQAITFYVDGKKMGSTPTPADYNQPMYMLMNLAVGGSWPGSPDSTTNWSEASMSVDYARAYSLTNTAMAAPDTISTAGGTVSASTGTASPSTGTVSASTGTASPSTGTASASTGTVSPSTGTASPSTGTASASTGTASVSTGTASPSTGTASVSTGTVSPSNGSTAAATPTVSDAQSQPTSSTAADTTGTSTGSVAPASTATTSTGSASVAAASTTSSSTGSVTPTSTDMNSSDSDATAADPGNSSVPPNQASAPAGSDTSTGDLMGNPRGHMTLAGGDARDASAFVARAHATISGFHPGMDSTVPAGDSADQMPMRHGSMSIALGHSPHMDLASASLGASHINMPHG